MYSSVFYQKPYYPFLSLPFIHLFHTAFVSSRGITQIEFQFSQIEFHF